MKTADGAGQRRQQGDAGRAELHQVLPARLRRHRAVRRQLRDRQHARDHRRAADARARHPAHARRLAAPGARLGRARVAGHRPRRLDHRALPRARDRDGPDGTARGDRRRPAEQRPRLLDADDRRQPRRRHADRAAREPAAGDPGHARRADRGRPRGRGHARVALRALRSGHARRSSARWRSALFSYGVFARRPRDQGADRRARRPACC